LLQSLSCSRGKISENCLPNIELDGCTNCEKNCSNWAINKPCENCIEGCVCKPGRIRGPEGNCIYWYECPNKKPPSVDSSI
ncbi:hypothetical protein NPIL_277201, partial [Nephila pilipes]